MRKDSYLMLSISELLLFETIVAVSSCIEDIENNKLSHCAKVLWEWVKEVICSCHQIFIMCKDSYILLLILTTAELLLFETIVTVSGFMQDIRE